jgi:bifunctional DNase/RNase
LVLGEVNGRRRLPIIIGSFEAQAIAIEIEKMTPSRPLTHDLFKSFAQAYHINVQEIIIYNLVDGIFYAKLICSDGKKSAEIDARTSDAIAMAVRFDCPIYTHEFILSSYTSLSIDELKTKLQEALAEEAYEKAAKIRDELNKRKAS